MQDLGFDTTQILIGGRWLACSGGRTLALSNPSDGSELARIARGEAADIDAAVEAAQAALNARRWMVQPPWLPPEAGPGSRHKAVGLPPRRSPGAPPS
jgi:hypothetical protein